MPSQAGGLLGAELLRGATKGLFNLGRKGASEAVKSDYAKQKIKDIANKYLDQALDRFTSDLSKKLDPVSGGALRGNTNPYCGVGKIPTGRKRGTMKECLSKGQIRYYGIEEMNKRIYDIYRDEKKKEMKYKKLKKKLENNKPTKKKSGGAIDIHKAILKVAPKKGFVMPGHRYTGPGNPLEQQLRYDPNTGQILEIYQQPTGRTDAVSMQHDVDYTVCGNKPKSDQVKCKNDADRKMVKAVDAIPWKDRQWGHAVARNAIAAKSKLGMGVCKVLVSYQTKMSRINEDF